MKKVTLILSVVMAMLLVSCGNSKKENKKEAKKIKKTEQVTQKQEVKKEENIYVKNKYLQDMDLKATADKYSQEDWDRISRVTKDYSAFKKKNKGKAVTKEEFATFFKDEGYNSFKEGKDDVLKFAGLYEVSIAIPTNFGTLGTVKKLYGDEKYKESLKNMSDEYNKLGFTANDLKNIEKYSSEIGKASVMKVSLEYL